MPKVDPNDIIDFYVEEYTKVHKNKPTFNRVTSKIAISDMLRDFSENELKDLVKYYVNYYTGLSFDLKWFTYNYETVNQDYQNRSGEKERARKLASETQRRAEAWAANHAGDIISNL